MEFSDTLDGRGRDSAKAAETFLPLIPTTPRKAKLTEICGNFFIFLSFPTPPKIKNCQTNRTHFLFARPPRTACGFAKRERRFLSNPPLHGAILAIFENAKNERKKTGNLFLDFLSWCAAVMGGGYSVFLYGCSSNRNLNRAVCYPAP